MDVFIDKFCTEITHDYGNMNNYLTAHYCRITDGTIQISVHDKYKRVKIIDRTIAGRYTDCKKGNGGLS